MAQWVQHISGQGEKWKVETRDDSADTWLVLRQHQFNLFLPKSEYVPCEPPQPRRVDVTAECETCCGNGLIHNGIQLNMPITQEPQSRYWLRKVLVSGAILYDDKGNCLDGNSSCMQNRWAFIVEKEQP